MKLVNIVIVLAAVVALAGCATPYSKATAMNPNGFSEVMLDSTRAVVTFTSYRSDRAEAVIKGALLRAAELTKENGYDAFAIISDNANEQTTAFQSGGTYQGVRVGAQTFGSYNAGVPIIIAKSQQQLTVQFFKSGQMPTGGYMADEVIARNKNSFK